MILLFKSICFIIIVGFRIEKHTPLDFGSLIPKPAIL